MKVNFAVLANSKRIKLVIVVVVFFPSKAPLFSHFPPLKVFLSKEILGQNDKIKVIFGSSPLKVEICLLARSRLQ